MADVGSQPVTAAGRYAQLEYVREPFLRRARDAAALTIPGLLPRPGANGSTDLPQPFQSVGADGVNNLSSRLLLVLFPPGSSFFRLAMDDVVLDQLEQKTATSGENTDDARTELEEALGKVERAVTNRMEQRGTRTVRFEAIQHLIVTGNGLLHVMDDGAEKFFALDTFVVKRDADGNVLEILTKETLARVTLPENVQTLLGEAPALTDTTADPKEQTVDLFTWIKRENGQWTVKQEVNGTTIPESVGTYPDGKLPWIVLRWRIVPRNDYGRGRCEEYAGDLNAVDVGSQAILRYGAAAAKIVWLVAAGGTTDVTALAKAKSGDFVPGDPRDVVPLQLEKSQDFAVLKTVVDEAKRRLEKAFLLASSVQRDAERVTAEEIRTMIGQLEESLGGQYALLAEEMQRPLAVVHLAQMQKGGKLPPLPPKLVSPQIVTGLEGLGRNTDLQKLRAAVMDVGQTFGQPAIAQYVHVGNYMRRTFTSLGIDPKGLIRTDDEVQQAQAAAQQHELQTKLAPKMVDAGMNAAQMSMQQNGQGAANPSAE